MILRPGAEKGRQIVRNDTNGELMRFEPKAFRKTFYFIAQLVRAL